MSLLDWQNKQEEPVNKTVPQYANKGTEIGVPTSPNLQGITEEQYIKNKFNKSRLDSMSESVLSYLKWLGPTTMIAGSFLEGTPVNAPNVEDLPEMKSASDAYKEQVTKLGIDLATQKAGYEAITKGPKLLFGEEAIKLWKNNALSEVKLKYTPTNFPSDAMKKAGVTPKAEWKPPILDDTKINTVASNLYDDLSKITIPENITAKEAKDVSEQLGNAAIESVKKTIPSLNKVPVDQNIGADAIGRNAAMAITEGRLKGWTPEQVTDRMSQLIRDQLNITLTQYPQVAEQLIGKSSYKGAGALSSISSPFRVLSETPVADKLDLAESYITRDVNWVRSIIKKFVLPRDVESQSRMFDAMDGVKDVTLSNDEKLIVNRVLKPMLKHIAEVKGLPPDKRITYYVPHVIENLEKNYQPVPRELLSYVPSSVKSGFEKSRTGSHEYSKDLGSVLDTYASSMLRSAHLDPVVKDIASHYAYLPSSTKEYLKWYVSSQIKNLPSIQNDYLMASIKSIPVIGEAVAAKIGDRPADSASGLIRSVIYANALGARPKQFVINLTQNTNYAAITPLVDIMTYAPKAALRFTTPEGKKLLQLSGVMEDTMIKNETKGISTAVSNLTNNLMWNIRSSEAINRGAIYLTELERQLGKGKPVEEAMNIARKVTLDVHFRYSGDLPRMFTSPLGRLSGTMATYPIKMTEWAWDLLKNKQLGSLLKYIGLTYGIVKGAEYAGVDVAKELGGGLFGNSLRYAPLGFLPTSVPIATLAGKMLKGDVSAYVPGGRLANDIMKGMDLGTDGKLRDKSGKIVYESDDPIDPILVGLGFNPTERMKTQAASEIARSLSDESNKATVEVAILMMNGDMDKAREKFQEYSSKGLIDAQTIVRKVQSLQTSPAMRAWNSLSKLNKVRLLLELQKRGYLQ